MRTHYRILSFLLFVGFLAGCSSGTPETIEEQTTFATYTFEAEADGMALTGRLALDILDNGPQRLFTGALILEDGTRLLSSGSIQGNFIRVRFLGDNIESLGAKELDIYGWGALEGDDSYAGDLVAQVTPMGEEVSAEDAVLATGTWSATPTSQGDEPGDDTTGGGGDEPIDEPIALAERYTLTAQYGDDASLSGELALEPTGDATYEGVWSYGDGFQFTATAILEGENVTLTLSGEASGTDVTGSGQVGDDGVLKGSLEGTLFGEEVAGGEWTATPISDDDEDDTPSDPNVEEGTVFETYKLRAQYDGGRVAFFGELTLEPATIKNDVEVFEGTFTFGKGGAQVPAILRLEEGNDNFGLGGEIDGRKLNIGGNIRFYPSGSFGGSFKDIYGSVLAGTKEGTWSARPIPGSRPIRTPSEDPTPPSDPGDGDGETEFGTVRVDITVASEDVSGTVTVEKVLEGDETEVVASSDFSSSGQGNRVSETLEQTLEPGDYILRVAVEGVEDEVTPFDLEPGGEETFDLTI